jgi:sec-independent protein translocase protein TatB
MFDIGFSELFVIGVVALIVLGPERLPRVARTAGHLFGRFQRYVTTVKADIQREMDAAELAKLKTEVQDAAKAFEHSVNQEVNTAETEMRALEQSVADSANSLNPSEDGSARPVESTATPGDGAPAEGVEPYPESTQQRLDLGDGGDVYVPPSTQQKLVN